MKVAVSLTRIFLFLFTGVSCKDIYVSPTGNNEYDCGNFTNPCQDIEYVIKNLLVDNDTILLNGSATQSIEYIVSSNIDVKNSFTINKANIEQIDPVIRVMKGSEPSHTLFRWDTTKKVHITLRNIKFLNTKVVRHYNGHLSISIHQCSMIHAGWGVIIHSTTVLRDTAHIKVDISDSYVKLSAGLLFYGERNAPIDLSIRNSILIGGRVRHHQTPKQWNSNDGILLNNVTFEKIQMSVIELYDPPNVLVTNVIFKNMGGESNVFTVYNTIPRSNSKSTVMMKNVTFQRINPKYRVLIDIKECTASIDGLTIKESENISGISTLNSMLTINNFVSKDNVYIRQFQWSSQSIINIGRMLYQNNTNQIHEGVELSKSNVTIREIVFKGNQMLHRPLLLLDSEIRINSVRFNNNIIMMEAIRLDGGHLTIDSLTQTNNDFHQGLLVTKGSCIIHHGNLHNNTAESTLLGATHRPVEINGYYKISNVNFSGNTIRGNMIHLERIHRTSIRNISMANNAFSTGIQLEKSHAYVNDVVIAKNEAKGRWKALRYNDEGDEFDVSINNFYAVFAQFSTYIEKDTILVVEVKYSNVTMHNVRIELENMSLPATSVAKFVLGSENHHVKPDIHITCATNYNPNENIVITDTLLTQEVFCEPCPRGRYSIQRGKISTWKINNEWLELERWTRNNSHLQVFQSNNTVYKCHQCPTGGDCNNGIKSRGNFYGYNLNDTSIKFIPCPNGYCCSQQGQRCTDTATCNYHRTGRLCGQCLDGYYENYLSSTCTPKKFCTKSKQETFWIMFFFTALLFTFSICFMKDFVTILKIIAEKCLILMQRLKLLSVTSSESSSNESVIYTINIADDDVFTKTPEIKGKQKEVEVINCEVTNPSMYCKATNRETNRKTNRERRRSSIFHNECMNDMSNARKFTVAAVVQIIISFYQMRTLITIDSRTQSSISDTSNVLSRLCNFELFIKIANSMCPFENIDSVSKLLIKNILFTVLMLFIVLVSLIISYILQKFVTQFIKNHVQNTIPELLKELKKLPLYQKLMVCYLKVLIIGYKNLSFFAVTLTNCVSINDVSYLFISGKITCYQSWQFSNFAFLFLWVLPFPIALTCLYYLLKKRAINSWVFMIGLTFPIATPIFVILRKAKIKFTLTGSDHEQELRGVLYELFEEPYRCTKTHSFFWWQTWRLYERLLLVAITIYVFDPIIRMAVVTPVILVLLWLHIYLKPYKKTMTILSWLNITSYICLCVQLVNSSFQSVIYTFDIPLQHPIDVTLKAFEYFEIIFSPLVVLLMYITGQIFNEIITKTKTAMNL